MALFDFLKRKRETENPPTGGEKTKKAQKKTAPASAAKEIKKPAEQEEKKPASPVLRPKRRAGFSYDTVREPHISEGATNLAEKNQYVFKVLPGANKLEIKKAVEGIYGVDVLSVNKIKIPAKKRRLGRTEGFRKSCVKAVVKIKEGQKIEIL
jgi:large subunit ribosomal protein L23